MSNNKRHFPLFALIVLGWAVFTSPALAQSGVLTVTGLTIDKTDKNAVVARDAAIVAAKRTALQIIAQQSMSPEAYKSFTLPDDKTIALLVQDFEIKNERFAANRYAAMFTVRFSPGINTYISVPPGVGPIIVVTADGASTVPSPTENAAAGTPEPAKAANAYALPEGPRNILVLPYLKDTSGKRLLWEDPNPWREAWQDNGNITRSDALTVTVPQGDLDDVSAGSTEAPWSGNYATLEKLRAAYKATEVALAVANQSVSPPVINIYMYREAALTELMPVEGFKIDQSAAMIDRVVQAVTAPVTVEASPSAPMASSLPATSAPLKLALVMRFGAFSEWAEAQRRLTSLLPSDAMNINGLTRNSVRITVTYTGGNLEAFRAALIDKGLTLKDQALDGGVEPAQDAVYELALTTPVTPPAIPVPAPAEPVVP